MAGRHVASSNPLFYRDIVPLDRERHRSVRLAAPGRPYAFAETSQFIPALSEEFAAACRDLAVVFMPAPQRPTALFVVGLRAGQNLLVTPEGQWDGGYVPAFLRRYPFIRGDIEGADPVVCIDASFEGLNEERGEAFFEDGRQTAYLDSQVGFVNAYFEASQRSDAFCEMIQRLDLLKSVTIDIKSKGVATSLHGLLAVDEEKLDALPAKKFEELRKARALPAIYAHLVSMGAVSRLSARLDAERAGLDA
jgi:hypothetical protein